MKALQVIYSFFLGLALATFVGIGMATFYPRPEANFDYPVDEKSPVEMEAYRAESEAYAAVLDTWSLNTSIILLILATVILVVALVLGERLVVLSNGMLMGGLFTLLYAVANSFSNSQNLLRFAVIAVALAVTIAVGWMKFRTGPSVVAADRAPASAAEGDATLEGRVTELEERLESMRKALGGD